VRMQIHHLGLRQSWIPHVVLPLHRN
jgi:hypothetical protein